MGYAQTIYTAWSLWRALKNVHSVDSDAGAKRPRPDAYIKIPSKHFTTSIVSGCTHDAGANDRNHLSSKGN